MERLLVKKYELNLNIERRFLFIRYNKVLKLKFEQAKLIDTIEFINITSQSEFGIIMWLLNFIEEKSWIKLNMKIRQYIMLNRDSILKTIKETFFEWCFTKEEVKWDYSPFSSYITILSEKLNIDPVRLAKEYTPQQLEFLTEWLVWNANEASKDWQKKNKLRRISQKNKNRSEEEQLKIKTILDSMKK